MPKQATRKTTTRTKSKRAGRSSKAKARARPTKRSKTRRDSSFRKRIFPVVPDKIDPRDYSARSFGIFGDSPVPAVVDHSPHTPQVGDQGETGSCVGWATSYLRSWLHHEQTGQSLRFSARFIWMGSKEIDQHPLNALFENAGTQIRDAFKIMRNHGATPNEQWPFHRPFPSPATREKEDLVKKAALSYRIGNYYPLANNAERRQNLAQVGPFVLGVPVFDNWNTIGNDGLVPDPGGLQRGGHAILVVGYDDQRGVFKFQNSWRASWGDGGFGYFTYEWVEKYAWSSWAADRLS